MTIEIVDFPIENGGSFHSYVNVYQRGGWGDGGMGHIPSGKRLTMERSSILNGKTQLFLWPFSIATLNYQRV